MCVRRRHNLGSHLHLLILLSCTSHIHSYPRLEPFLLLFFAGAYPLSPRSIAQLQLPQPVKMVQQRLQQEYYQKYNISRPSLPLLGLHTSTWAYTVGCTAHKVGPWYCCFAATWRLHLPARQLVEVCWGCGPLQNLMDLLIERGRSFARGSACRRRAGRGGSTLRRARFERLLVHREAWGWWPRPTSW